VIKKKDINQEDVDTWQDYIKNPNDIIDKDNFLENNQINKRFKFDLHGYTLIAANEKAKEIILSCVQKNYKEILLITGKGIHSSTDNDTYVSKNLSKLKFSVPEYIKSDPDISNHIISISDAEKKDGGEGAIIIKIRKL
jgi:DNA-nicking Smr family endonuclease